MTEFDDEDLPEQEDDQLEENASGEKRRRLSPAQWIAISEAYELGTKGITELAEEYGVSRQTISNFFKKNGVQRGSKAQQIAQANAQAAAAASAKVAERYAEKRAEWIEETRIQGYNNLKQAATLLNRRIIEIYKTPGAAPAAAMDDIKALKLYQSALIENFNFRLEGILRANEIVDENNLPSLEISDLTEEDLEAHYESMGMGAEAAEDATGDLNDIVDSLEEDDG